MDHAIPPSPEAHQQLFQIRDAVNRVSRHLPESDSSAIEALLDLRTASTSILSLSKHLSQLADSVHELHTSKPSSRHGIVSFVARRLRSHEVSRLAAEVSAELQALIDRESVAILTRTVAETRSLQANSSTPSDDDKVFDEMSVLQERLSQGFDMNLQDLLLKSTIFSDLEWVLCNPVFSTRVREKTALLMAELVLFNKDVFVGSFLVGGSVEALISMGSHCSLQALSSLIKAIRSPLVDEILSRGGIPKIVNYLSSSELDTKVMAMDCAMKIGYFGRKEAVEAMIDGGIVKRLVELQRLENGDGEMKGSFERCVARFAVQLEVGEGLRQREKRALKLEILSKVREACDCDAECATIVAEVLWGSSP